MAQVSDLSRAQWLELLRQDPRFAASLSARSLALLDSFGSDHVHVERKLATFCRLISFSGLNP